MKEIQSLNDNLAIHHSDYCLKSVGIDSKGKKLEYVIDSNGILFCPRNDLVSLDIPKGVKKVYCYDNNLTELIIPEGVIELYCSNNQLTELIISNSIKHLFCDRHILGIDNIYWKCNIRLL